MDNLNLSDITQEEKKELERVAEFGFAFIKMLEAMPDHLSAHYEGYFEKRGMRNFTRMFVRKFCSVTLAIARGHNPAARRKHLQKKHAHEDLHA